MIETTKKQRTSPAKFVREVRSETARVVWPTRRETGLTTVMVFVLVSLAMFFLFMIDQVLRIGIEWVVRLGG